MKTLNGKQATKLIKKLQAENDHWRDIFKSLVAMKLDFTKQRFNEIVNEAAEAAIRKQVKQIVALQEKACKPAITVSSVPNDKYKK